MMSDRTRAVNRLHDQLLAIRGRRQQGEPGRTCQASDFHGILSRIDIGSLPRWHCLLAQAWSRRCRPPAGAVPASHASTVTDPYHCPGTAAHPARPFGRPVHRGEGRRLHVDHRRSLVADRSLILASASGQLAESARMRKSSARSRGWTQNIQW